MVSSTSRTIRLICLILLCGGAGSASAQVSFSTGAPKSGGRKSGFLHRAAVGGGYTAAGERTELDDLGFRGAGVSAALATGRFFLKNLAFHVEMFGSVLLGPTVEVNQVETEMSGELACMAVGAGATYYFMPINIYLAGTLGAGAARVGGGGISGGTDIGFAANALLGKEWWLNEDWGLGAAGQFYMMALPDETTLTVLGAGLLVSISLNVAGRPTSRRSKERETAAPAPSPQTRPSSTQEQPEEKLDAAEVKSAGGDAGEAAHEQETFEPEKDAEERAGEGAGPEIATRTVRGRGWAIDMPLEWVVVEATAGTIAAFREPTLETSSFATVTLEVELFMGDSSAYRDKLLKDLASSVVQHRSVVVAGLQGIEIEADMGGKPPRRMLQRATADGGAGYRVSCLTDESVFEKKRAVCRKILDSFRFEHAARLK